VAVRARVPEERILELPNPPRWGAVEALRNTADPEQPRLITAARLISGKGIDVLLRAFAAVSDEFPQARLDIAGEGKDRAVLEGLARELRIQDRVRFLGWVPAHNMPLEFAGCLVAVLPSRVEEGHPMALREAALSGCALIGSDLGGIKDIVKPGKTGILGPPDDPSALARALRDCLLHPDRTRRFGRAARAEALAYFDRRERALAELRRRLYTLLAGPDRPGVPG
jgi:glycosyltransferase involved in cell wall biosynthesis